MRIENKKLKLTDYQERILYSKARFTIATCATKVGKTHSHIYWLYEQAHQPSVRDGMNFWWVAPVHSQAKIAYKRMKRKLIRTKAYKFNESELIILCPNGAEIHFKSGDSPDGLYGEDVYAAVIDEAGRCKKEAWDAVFSTLTFTNAPCKLIGNFGGSNNWVTRLVEKTKDDPDFEYFKVTAYDAVNAGILDLKVVEQAKKTLSESVFKALYLAEGGNDEGQQIDDESILKLFTNTTPFGTRYITADIARFGKDRTVIFVWDGLRIIHATILETSKVTETADSIKALKVKYNVNTNNIACDADGVGGGVVDILGCRNFVNNSRPMKVNGIDVNYASLKDQCLAKLCELMNANLMAADLPHEIKEKLSEELKQIKLPKEIDTQRIKFLGKDEIKKQIGRSPDFLDAMLIRCLWEVSPNHGVYHVYF